MRLEFIDNDFVSIRIADNGSGRNDKFIKRLLNLFFTTKPISGTGLGLSISYQIIVQKHKGQLRCINQPGQGTEFVIKISIPQATNN